MWYAAGPMSSFQFACSPWSRIVRAIQNGISSSGAIPVVLVAALLYFFSRQHADSVALVVKQWRLAYGIWIPLLFTSVCGGLIPWVLSLSRESLKQRWRVDIFLVVGFWAYKGIEVDAWYKLIAHVVSTDTRLEIILVKILLDQALYAPLWAVIVTVLFYRWRLHCYSAAAVRKEICSHGSFAWYRRYVIPALGINLLVWGPASIAIFALPLPLQIVCFNILLVVYVIAVQTLTSGSADPIKCSA